MFVSVVCGAVGSAISLAVAQYFDVTAIATFLSWSSGVACGVIVAVAK